jgi:hypothetical protein
MQIIANRAPVGFEAEFENPHGDTICYRGILMPFSSDGDTIDFIYGVINWKHVEDSIASAPTVADEAPVDVDLQVDDVAEPVFDAEPAVDDYPAEDDQPLELTEVAQVEETESATPTIVPEEPSDREFAELIEEPVLADDAGLADRLWAARETAETVKAGEGRTRAALYQALSLAYDFALAAHENPEEYAELLEESGVKAQVRAPMTPIVKLVFGVDYDKARLTEFAAALSYAQRQEIGFGAFQDFIEQQAGGLKSLVAAERQARRPEPKSNTKGELARARLRTAAPISLEEVPAEEEFAVVVTRRGADGRHQLVAIVEDEALIERAIRRAV